MRLTTFKNTAFYFDTVKIQKIRNMSLVYKLKRQETHHQFSIVKMKRLHNMTLQRLCVTG